MRRVLAGAVGRRTRFLDGEFLFFGGNNYLGLANRLELANATVAATRRYGTSAGGSRVTTGTIDLHQALENKVAEFKGAEDACVFSCGYLGTRIILQALMDDGDPLVIDDQAHPSILDGIPFKATKVEFFAHNDAADLDRALAGKTSAVVVLEGLTWAGEIAPLDDIISVIERHEALLVVDDAHASGILGEHGRGTPEHFAIESNRIIQVETFSKAYAAQGGFIAAPRVVCEQIREQSVAYQGSTSMAPPAVGAALAAVVMVMKEPDRRRKLEANAAHLTGRLRSIGFDIPHRGAPIACPAGLAEEQINRLHAVLHDHHICVPVVRYPTENSPPRLRFTVSAEHEPRDIERLCDLLERHA